MFDKEMIKKNIAMQMGGGEMEEEEDGEDEAELHTNIEIFTNDKDKMDELLSMDCLKGCKVRVVYEPEMETE